MKSIYLRHIGLYNFKNYEEEQFQIHGDTLAMVGHNGMGKTNLLDAIYYLCMAKSYFSVQDKSIIRQGESYFRLEGTFEIGGEINKVVIKVSTDRKKVIEWNGKAYSLLSEHIGKLPIVMICPKDHDIINGLSFNRRRFIDRTLCQTDRNYLNNLAKYKRVLKQRNAFLKRSSSSSVNHSLLDSYDELMQEPALYIYRARRGFVEEIRDLYEENLARITGGNEVITLQYVSQLNRGQFSELLKSAREKDIILQRTTHGPHKDDLTLTYRNLPFRKHASQGQIKSTLLALKLAQAIFLRTKSKLNPIILIDDIFDKLDNQRVEQLLGLLRHLGFPQIFISDAHETRFEESLENKSFDVSRYWVENGTIELIKN
jgi:DNA replication and repair protein RecF